MTRHGSYLVSDDDLDSEFECGPVSDLDSAGPTPAIELPPVRPKRSVDGQRKKHQRKLRKKQSRAESVGMSSSCYEDSVDSLSQALSGIPLEDHFHSHAAYHYPARPISSKPVGRSQSTYTVAGHGVKREKSLYNRVKSYIDWGSKESLIAVMGMTGSGKTTFISKVTGRTDLKIGHNLTSCTREINVVETKIGEHTVRFVDTPGFSDTSLSDTEVLQMIADYLASAYRNELKLTGIIYLHPISDTRVTHHATKNLEMFRKLTGEKNLKNVLLATTMWDKVTPDEGYRRERELRQRFWKVLIAYEARVAKYRGTPESARHLAAALLGNEPFYLQLQEEMGRGNKALRDTAAGRELMVEITRMKEEHQKELVELKDSMLKASAEENRIVIEALQEHYQGRLAELERTLRDERVLNDEAVRFLTRRIDALESRHSCAVM